MVTLTSLSRKSQPLSNDASKDSGQLTQLSDARCLSLLSDFATPGAKPNLPKNNPSDTPQKNPNAQHGETEKFEISAWSNGISKSGTQLPEDDLKDRENISDISVSTDSTVTVNERALEKAQDVVDISSGDSAVVILTKRSATQKKKFTVLTSLGTPFSGVVRHTFNTLGNLGDAEELGESALATLTKGSSPAIVDTQVSALGPLPWVLSGGYHDGPKHTGCSYAEEMDIDFLSLNTPVFAVIRRAPQRRPVIRARRCHLVRRRYNLMNIKRRPNSCYQAERATKASQKGRPSHWIRQPSRKHILLKIPVPYGPMKVDKGPPYDPMDYTPDY